jgi:DNA end-binding protein Ku
MERPAWKGTLSFGLVEIPVALVPADKSDELDFKLLDERDLAPIGYKKVNKSTGEEVPSDAIVKGYEHAEGRYVVLTDDDFARANVKATGTIEIDAFVRESEIDPVHYERPYYVVPQKRAGKAYAILRDALARRERAGIATVVLRNRSHLAAVLPRGKALILILLRYAHELRQGDEIEIAAGDRKVAEREVAMAEKLVESLASKFRPDRYHDSYRDDLLALIEKRARSGGRAAPRRRASEPKPRATSNGALLRLLKRSVEQTDHRRPSRKTPAPSRRRSA